jgi:hypothetical protein
VLLGGKPTENWVKALAQILETSPADEKVIIELNSLTFQKVYTKIRAYLSDCRLETNELRRPTQR